MERVQTPGWTGNVSLWMRSRAWSYVTLRLVTRSACGTTKIVRSGRYHRPYGVLNGFHCEAGLRYPGARSVVSCGAGR